MEDSVDREIKVGDIITYAQRMGDTGGLAIAIVRGFTAPKATYGKASSKIAVDIPTAVFKGHYVGGKWTPGARYLGSSKKFILKRVYFEYPKRATVVPDRDEDWFMTTFKIGETVWHNGQYQLSTEEEVLGNG